MVDFGVHERSLPFIYHSKFVPKGFYEKIHEDVVAMTTEYYLSLKVHGYKARKQVYKKDLELMRRVFLPCTWDKAVKIRAKLEVEDMEKRFLKEFSEFTMFDLPSDQEHELVYSPFGNMLFKSELRTESSQRVKSFIDYMICRNRIEEVIDYNEFVKYI